MTNKWAKKARKLWVRILDLFYPRFCAICKTSLNDADGKFVCENCEKKLNIISGYYCLKCGSPIGDSFDTNIERCEYCSTVELYFERAVAVGRYSDGLRELILQMKPYSGQYLAGYLGNLLVDRLSQQDFIRDGTISAVVPVPIWSGRLLFIRKYNQAELLAETIASKLGLKYIGSGLIKVKYTPPQTTLDREGRLRNLIGAFNIKRRGLVADKKVLLIDDVLTTGATASECAKALKRAGAKAVYVGTVGR